MAAKAMYQITPVTERLREKGNATALPCTTLSRGVSDQSEVSMLLAARLHLVKPISLVQRIGRGVPHWQDVYATKATERRASTEVMGRRTACIRPTNDTSTSHR